jgi:hypothetical protein
VIGHANAVDSGGTRILSVADRDKDGSVESRRILDRIAREADSSGSSLVSRTVRRARDHVSAADVDDSDWIDHLGTRIGRVLGLVICVGLLAWLVIFLVRGA